MLPTELQALNYQEEWEDYIARVGVPEDEAMHQFFRQVIYDHFEHHNCHFPDFEINDYHYTLTELTVSEVRDKVKFFPGDSLSEMWSVQFDQFFEEDDCSYIIHQEMVKNKTPPFPPIIIDSSKLKDKGWRIYGRPLHLIEGTHRTSYLLRMAERGIITWCSKHEFVLLTPKNA